MSAPIRLKCDPEVWVKKGGDSVIIGIGSDRDSAIVIFHDELPELIEVLSQIIKEKK